MTFGPGKQTHPISPVRKRKNVHNHAKRDSRNSLSFFTNSYRTLCDRFSTCPIPKTYESSTPKNFCAVTQPFFKIPDLSGNQDRSCKLHRRKVLFQVAKIDSGAILYVQMYHRKNISHPEQHLFLELMLRPFSSY